MLRILLLFFNVYALDFSHTNDLGFNLVAKVKKPLENECISVLSIASCFNLLYPLAGGTTFSELQSVFGFSSKAKTSFRSYQDLKLQYVQTSQNYVPQFEWEQTRPPIVVIAQKFYLQMGFRLKPTALEIVGDNVEMIDFGKANEAKSKINNWVSKQTQKMIPKTVDKIPSGLLSMAVNTIYFKGSWSSPFSEAEYGTRKMKFTDIEGVEKNYVAMMENTDYFPFYDNPDRKIIGLQFKESQIYMFIDLPKKKSTRDLTSSEFQDLIRNKMKRRRVNLLLPRFSFSREYGDDLKAALIKENLKTPFDAVSSNFDGIENENGVVNGVFVSQIIHKTRIEVNENGVVAAAVTASMMAGSAMIEDKPIEMTCDHPFNFYLYDEKENVMLFQGHVEKPDNAPEGMKMRELKLTKPIANNFIAHVKELVIAFAVIFGILMFAGLSFLWSNHRQRKSSSPLHSVNMDFDGLLSDSSVYYRDVAGTTH